MGGGDEGALGAWRRRLGSRSLRRRALQELPCRALRQVIITNVINIVIIVIIIIIIIITTDVLKDQLMSTCVACGLDHDPGYLDQQLRQK